MEKNKHYANAETLRGFIFDFDGTLIRSDINFYLMRKKIIEHMKKWNIWKEDFEIQKHILEMISLGCAALGNETAQVKIFKKEAFEIIEDIEIETCSKALLFPRVIETMKILSTHKYHIGIITRNGRKAVDRALSRYSLPYEVLFTRNDVVKVKPDPAHLLSAINCLDMTPSEAVMVGDHPTDIECGKRAGTLTIGVLSGTSSREELLQAGADYVMKGVPSIIEFLGLDIQ